MFASAINFFHRATSTRIVDASFFRRTRFRNQSQGNQFLTLTSFTEDIRDFQIESLCNVCRQSDRARNKEIDIDIEVFQSQLFKV